MHPHRHASDSFIPRCSLHASSQALLVIGYKTRLSAVTLFVLLMVENLTLNDFFMHDVDDHMHDYKKFNFFQVNFIPLTFQQLTIKLYQHSFFAKKASF